MNKPGIVMMVGALVSQQLLWQRHALNIFLPRILIPMNEIWCSLDSILLFLSFVLEYEVVHNSFVSFIWSDETRMPPNVPCLNLSFALFSLAPGTAERMLLKQPGMNGDTVGGALQLGELLSIVLQ
jgi:cobalamin synthase